MSEPADQPELHVTADLHLDVDGVRAQVTGDGQRVDVTTDHPVRLLAAAGGTRSSRGAFAQIADALADSGVTVELSGSHGPVGSAGRDVNSRVGRWAAGSSHVRVAVDRRLTFAVVALAAAGLAVLVRRLSHR